MNTLEAVYGQESSFGTLLGTRGSTKAAGHFQLQPETAKRYGLSVSKNNDHRFDLDDASSAGARYLKDLDTMFSKKTTLSRDKETVAVKSAVERKKFVLAAYRGGEGRIAGAQRLAENAGSHPQRWSDVQQFLELAGADKDTANQIRHYVQQVIPYEMEFAQKSPAVKNIKHKDVRKEASRCTEGHWVTIDERRVFICD